MYTVQFKKSNVKRIPPDDNIKDKEKPLGRKWGNGVQHDISSVGVDYFGDFLTIQFRYPLAYLRYEFQLSKEDAIEFKRALNNELVGL